MIIRLVREIEDFMKGGIDQFIIVIIIITNNNYG